MAKSFAKRQYEQTVVSSLLSTQAQREIVVEETTITLDQWFIGLGKAAKKSWEEGRITEEQFNARRQELLNQYRILKAQAA